MNFYETVFILTPVLSDDQAKEAVKKFEVDLTSYGAKMLLQTTN
jgi:small subunit ribosomal protein S6